jgi:hypothetical protein
MATASNNPQIIKGFIALLIAAGCLGLLVFLLTPVGPQNRGAVQSSSSVIVVKPTMIPRPILRSA